MSLKSSYVATMRGIRVVARELGVREPTPGERGISAHLRSLLGIHDAAALIQWDVPWWTYRAVDAVDALLTTRESARVFEYGSGASTVWLSRRAAEVHTVEHDSTWAESLSPHFATIANVTMHVVPPSQLAQGTGAGSGRKGFEGLDFAQYAATIDLVGGEFDLVVIDGRARMACLDRALRHLSSDGIIVVDNSSRRRYQHALRQCDMHVERLRGAAPGLPYPDETAILHLAANAGDAIPRPRMATGRESTRLLRSRVSPR